MLDILLEFVRIASTRHIYNYTGEDNENSAIGVKCGNCSFHVELSGTTELGCKILSFNVEENGLCRLAAIPDGLVNAESDDMDDMDNMNKFWNGVFSK